MTGAMGAAEPLRSVLWVKRQRCAVSLDPARALLRWWRSPGPGAGAPGAGECHRGPRARPGSGGGGEGTRTRPGAQRGVRSRDPVTKGESGRCGRGGPEPRRPRSPARMRPGWARLGPGGVAWSRLRRADRPTGIRRAPSG